MFNMYEKCLDMNTGYSFGFGRWVSFIEHFSSKADKEDVLYYQNCLEKIKIFSSVFGSNKMVVFDSYNNQDIEGDIYDGKNIGIDDILKDKRWEIIENYGVDNKLETDKMPKIW